MAALVSNISQSRSAGSVRPPARPSGAQPGPLRFPVLDADVVAAWRPRAEQLTRRISARIHTEVAAFTETSMHSSISKAIELAVDFFTDALAGAPSRGREVGQFFRDLGRLEAEAGHDLDAMRAAHQIATQESWLELRRAGADLDLDRDVIDQLGHALLTFQSQLLQHAVRGFESTCAHRPHPRTQLMEAMLRGERQETVAELARRADWRLPATVCSMTTSLTTHTREVASAATEALAGSNGHRLTIIAADSDAPRIADKLAEDPDVLVTLTWGVDLDDAHHAARWSARLHRIALEGHAVIEPGTVLLCDDHYAKMCSLADGPLRRHTDHKVLAPLLDETPKRRAALAETMLLRLQTRESAPAIANRLGIHQQTVRLRLRRLKELFGDRLSDPSETVALLTALESVMPGWRAEAV